MFPNSNLSLSPAIELSRNEKSPSFTTSACTTFHEACANTRSASNQLVMM